MVARPSKYFVGFCSMLDNYILPQSNMLRNRLFPKKVAEICF